MKYFLLSLILLTGCSINFKSQSPCCVTCTHNWCECDQEPEKCLCDTGSCNCRFRHFDDKKFEYIRGHLPKVFLCHESSN